jgi:predicted ester cyclase
MTLGWNVQGRPASHVAHEEKENTMAESNKQILRRIADEVVNGRNLAAADALFSRDYVVHGPGGLELRGPEGFKQMIGMYQNAFRDYTVTFDDMIEEGDRIAFRLTLRGSAGKCGR